MEPVKKDLSAFGPSITFFRDDIEEILAILKATCPEVKISDATHRFDSLDELIEKKGERPSQLLLNGWSPYVSLDIRPLTSSGVHLFATSSSHSEAQDPEVPFLKIKGYLNKRGYVGPPSPRGLVRVLYAVAFIAFISGPFLPRSIPNVLTATVSLGFILMCAASLRLLADHGFFSRIRLGRRHQATTFWSRNAERLIVGLIGAALGAAATELVHWLVAKATGSALQP